MTRAARVFFFFLAFFIFYLFHRNNCICFIFCANSHSSNLLMFAWASACQLPHFADREVHRLAQCSHGIMNVTSEITSNNVMPSPKCKETTRQPNQAGSHSIDDDECDNDYSVTWRACVCLLGRIKGIVAMVTRQCKRKLKRRCKVSVDK